MAFEVHFTNAAAVRKTYCTLRAPTVFSARMKSASAQKTRLWIKARAARGFTQDRRLRADGCFIRAQSTIRADGISSAQQQGCAAYCALRAPTVFSVRIKSIRTENTVMDKSKGSVGFYTTSQLCNNGGVI